MKKIIVTTTIYSPSESLLKFSEMDEWELIVVGDKKTPHREYEDVSCYYMHPDEQSDKYPELSKTIGWNNIQRRNIGFIEAYKRGAEIVATVDDDNIPLDHWGKNIFVGQTVDVIVYDSHLEVFDPLSVTNHSDIWHRGYPVELLDFRRMNHGRRIEKRKIQVQADLWNGDPDVDAMVRLTQKPEVEFEPTGLFASNRISPFNSQNTFISREVLPHYAVLPYVGRMDDIWGSYILQTIFPNCVAYYSPSVYQERNEQDLVKNLEDEIIGYRNTLNFIRNGCSLEQSYIPANTRAFYEEYRNCFE